MPVTEPFLGKKIILVNKPGATGAIATTYVFNQPADGYTLLFGAENPSIYKVLGIADIDYVENFEPIIILSRVPDVIVVKADSKYKTLKDLIEDAKANPGKIKAASTGIGGLPYVVGAIMRSVHGVEFNMVEFPGDGPGLTALLGGHVEVMPAAITAAAEFLRSGMLRALAVVNTERLSSFPDVPAITEIYPEYGKYLPYSHWYGVFVKKETPKEVVDRLVEAFKKGFDHPGFQDFLKNANAIPAGYIGEEARNFLARQRSIASWLIYEAGAAKKSPADLGIPKP